MLSFHIQCAGCFIKDDQLRITIECPGKAESLALTSTQLNAAFPKDTVQAGVHRPDQVCQLGLLKCPPDPLKFDRVCRPTESNIARHRPFHQGYLLGHIAERPRYGCHQVLRRHT